MLSEILIETSKKARIITLNREKALNSLNVNMVRILSPLYNSWMQGNEDVACIIMKGAGSKAFCAGGDVVSLAKDKTPKNTPSGPRAVFFREEYTLNYLIKKMNQLKKPIYHVSILDGITMGGGVGLSVHGSHRIITENTVFAMPETAIGLFPDVGGSLFLPRLPYKGLGMFLALSGYRLKGADVCHSGVGTHFINREKVKELTHDLTVIEKGEQVNEIINHHNMSSSLPPFSLTPQLKDIQGIFHDSASLNEIISKLEKEKAVNPFWDKIYNTIIKCSPTSLAITFEQIKRGEKQSDEENFLMEYRMVQACMDKSDDFNEGIRALLIDKTNDPKWNPKSLKDITDDYVSSFFQPHPNDLILSTKDFKVRTSL